MKFAPKYRRTVRTAFMLTAAALFLMSAQHALANTQIYPIDLKDYPTFPDLWQTLVERVRICPFNAIASVIFVLAILHTFSCGYITKAAENAKRRFELGEEAARAGADKGACGRSLGIKRVSFKAATLHLLGEVEAVFALWLIPLLVCMACVYGWHGMTSYIDGLTFTDKKYVEPLFVVIVMYMASTRPVIQASSAFISLFARALGGGVRAWWLAILCVGPLMGSLITEPAAITICATLLLGKFFVLKPRPVLRYATIGLLLVAISAGGTLTHFAAPPVLMVAREWGWDTPFMFEHFGWKAIVGICVSAVAYAVIFAKDFSALENYSHRIGEKSGNYASVRAPLWVVAVHCAFLAFTVTCLHHPILFVFAFLLFLAFQGATEHYQDRPHIRVPLMVGVFLASLVTHGSLQSWWIAPVLETFDENALFAGSMFLTSFNDNAAITYLASLVPDFSDSMKYMVVAGAVAGGGLTVIANAPNPAGLALLKNHFDGGISPLKLLYASVLPTAFLALAFYLL